MQILLFKLCLFRMLCLIISYPPTLSKLSWVNVHEVIDCPLISNQNILLDCGNHNWWINQRKLRAFMCVIWVENRNPSNALKELLGYYLVTFKYHWNCCYLWIQRFSYLFDSHWAIFFLFFVSLVLDTQWYDTDSKFSEFKWENLSLRNFL